MHSQARMQAWLQADILSGAELDLCLLLKKRFNLCLSVDRGLASEVPP